MYRDYRKLIKESAKELKKLNKEHRQTLVGSRLQLMYLLKSGEARTVTKASQLLHYSREHCQRWLKVYREEGLKGLLKPEKKAPGSKERMTPEAWEKLYAALKQGEIAS